MADLILISQCTYYNTINARRRAARLEHHHAHHHHHHHHHHANGHHSQTEDDLAAGTSAAAADSAPTESDPLLNSARPRSDSGGLPGSHRRHEIHRRSSTGLVDPLTRIITGEDDTPDSNPWLHNAVSLIAVWVVGGAGWFVSYRMGAWGAGGGGGEPVPDDGQLIKEPVAVVGMVLGYASALCYLWYVAHFFFLFPPLQRHSRNREPTVRGSRRSSKTTAKSRARGSPCCSSCSP